MAQATAAQRRTEHAMQPFAQPLQQNGQKSGARYKPVSVTTGPVL
jgi:hypothetical protein